MMNAALERSMNDQQHRIQKIASLASQRSNGLAAFDEPLREIENGQAIEALRSEKSSFATPVDAPPDGPIEVLSTPPSSTTSRFDAIAKLKRAASQREMRGRGQEASLSAEDGNTDSAPGSVAHGEGISLHAKETVRKVEPASPFLAIPGGRDGSKSTSPTPPGSFRLEQLGSHSPSPQRSLRDEAGTPDGGSLLNRSRSQRGDARSPLPSLEQLRARILQERATAGLARSASTSAASAAARAYALEKLLGESPRQGAVSPVSDTAEDKEEEDVKGKEKSFMGPSLVSSTPRILLRRSRTIGGLSAAAEAQRKAAFVQALDEGVPEDVKSIRRSSRRFAKAPPGGNISTAGKQIDPPLFEEPIEELSNVEKEKEESLQVPVEKSGSDLERNQSQRQIARTEMMRKLSGRGRNGQRSPLPGLNTSSKLDQLEVASSDISSSSPLPPITPPAAVSLSLPSVSPGTNLLMVPGAGHSAQSPSSRPSTGMTSIHESDRNRASEMARLMGEEAFEYERLLEMGYTTDDAYERVASARSGSFMDLSAQASPISYQGEFSYAVFHQQQESSPSSKYPGRPSQRLEESMQDPDDPFTESASDTAQSVQGGWPIENATFASIPLGLASRMSSGSNAEGQNEQVEMLDNDDILLPSNRRAAWPESVTSAATFDTISSPKHSSGSTTRESEGGSSTTKYRPPNLTLLPTHSVERIEEVLTPGFLKEIGNPLDYSAIGESPQAHRKSKSTYSESDDNDGGSDDGDHSDAGDNDYLEKVDQMTRKLGRFARRNNNNATRSDRDAAVQQSSAAQVEAAASQDAQRSLTPEMIMMTPSTSQQRRLNVRPDADPKVLSIASSPRSSPPTSFRPLPGSLNQSAGNSADSFQHYTNGKLSPFPGLFTHSNTSADTSSTSMARKVSPLYGIPFVAATDEVNPGDQKEVLNADEEKEAVNGPLKSPGFFTSLRRKASNAASRPHDNKNVTSLPATSPTSRKFGSLLRRKPSEAKHPELKREVESPPISVASLTSTSTLKLTPSSEQVSLPPMHNAAASTPVNPDSFASQAEVTTTRGATTQNPSPIITDTAALRRFSRMLTSPGGAAGAVGVLGLTRQDIDNPPRSFLFATPVLQVVTTSTVKDRYLFVFSDVLIIAKPMSPPTANADVAPSNLPTLEWTFSVKDILDIGQIKQLTAPTDERRRPARNVALMDNFVKNFQWDPIQAIDSLINQSGLPKTPATIAQFLHQTPELNRRQLTKYLFDDASKLEVTRAFIELEKLSGVSIESALRSLLLEIRFPARREGFDSLLVTFARHWTRSNRSIIKENFSEEIAIHLVFAIMSLNDALHGDNKSTPLLFSDAQPHLSKEGFLQAFRPKDKEMVLSDRTLSRIYTSVSQETIQQALHDNERDSAPIARILSPGIPSRLVYGIMSGPIRISIPRCDPDFTIRLYGEDLAFQPPVLSFAVTTTQEFKVLSKSLGPKSIVFIKAGRNARYYQTTIKTDYGSDFALPRSASLVVERAFKQHCFTIALSGNKKYTLSVEGEIKKNRCVDTIKGEMAQLANDPSRKTSAHTLALQVLKEALMEAEAPPSLQRSASAAVPTSSSRMEVGTLNRTPSDSRAFGSTARTQAAPVNRKESVSKHYYQSQGKREKGLATMMEGDEDQQNLYDESSIAPLRGEELITTVKQNSLLSVVVARLRQDKR